MAPIARPLLSAFVVLAVGIVAALGAAQEPVKFKPLGIRSAAPDRPVTTFVIDLADNGFQLTSADNGVRFDIDGTGTSSLIGWTAAGSDDGFLFLGQER